MVNAPCSVVSGLHDRKLVGRFFVGDGDGAVAVGTEGELSTRIKPRCHQLYHQ